MERRNLKVLRVKKGLTQQQMAERIGISLSGYSRIESGLQKCSTKFLCKLQEAFGIPDSEIWDYTKLFCEMEE